MADKQVGNKLGVTAKDPTTDFAGAGAAGASNKGNYDSIANMKARLANGGTYTTEQLASMTYNDLVYALRLKDDAATV